MNLSLPTWSDWLASCGDLVADSYDYVVSRESILSNFALVAVILFLCLLGTALFTHPAQRRGPLDFDN